MRFGTVAFPLPAQDSDSDSSLGPSSSSRVTSFSECVYRGAYPKPRNLRFLETLHLRTIISLTPKPITDDESLEAWSKSQNGGAGIHVVHVRTEKPKEDSGGLTREGAARALMEVLNSENLPLYIHCLDGVDVTSTLIACLRKIQGWKEPAIHDELARGVYASTSKSAGPKESAPKHLLQFVERFGQPDGVLLPQRDRIPGWVWPRISVHLMSHDTWDSRPATVRHPTLDIHFERSESYIASQQARFGAVWAVFDHNRSRTPSLLSISDSSEGVAPDISLGSVKPSPVPERQQMYRRFSDFTHEKLTRAFLGQRDRDMEQPSDMCAFMSVDDQDLRTQRAKPQYVEGDVPPLIGLDLRTHKAVAARTAETDALAGGAISPDERTPLVVAQDAQKHRKPEEFQTEEPDDIPPLGLSPHNAMMGEDNDDRIVDLVDDTEEECDDMVDDAEQEEPSLALQALNLEGY